MGLLDSAQLQAYDSQHAAPPCGAYHDGAGCHTWLNWRDHLADFATLLSR